MIHLNDISGTSRYVDNQKWRTSGKYRLGFDNYKQLTMLNDNQHSNSQAFQYLTKVKQRYSM